jgi:hypothetical protein
MKLTHILFAAVLFLPALTPGAQEAPPWHAYPWSIGGGTELNQGSKAGWAQGYSVTLDRRFFDRRFVLGLRASMDRDYHTVSTFGGGGFLRLYPFTLGPGGAFAQFAFGLGSWQEDDRSAVTFVTDWAAGFRYCFLGGFYAELYVRSGFPSQWAFGILAGHLFTF